MQVTPPLPLLRRVPSGVWTALAWCAGLALTFLMRVRLPGEAEPAYSPGALLYRWDGLSFLIVASALVVAGSVLLDRRPLRALTLLLAASAVACMPLGVGEIPSAQFLAVDAALYFIAATAPRRTSIAAITMSLITLAGYLGTRLLFGWVVGTSAELAVAMTAVIAWLVGRSVHQAHEHAESLRIQATAQAITSERLRIARELHDMVAHSIGIIALQAGAARRVIDTQPVRAREALGEIETVGRETLSGLRRMLGALRHPEPTHPRETTPIPGPNPAQPPQSESSDRSTPTDQRPGALPDQSTPTGQRRGALPDQSTPTGQRRGALPDQPTPTHQRSDALPDQPTPTEQRPDASSSRPTPVEDQPGQRIELESGAPFGGSAVDEEVFGRCAPAELRSGASLGGSAVADLVEKATGPCAPAESGPGGSFGGFTSVEEGQDTALSQPALVLQRHDAALSRPAPVEQRHDAVLSWPAPGEQRHDASVGLGQHAPCSQYASVEPSQRMGSDCPESGQAPSAVPFDQPESGPTPSTAPHAPLDPAFARCDPASAPLDPGLARCDPGLTPAGLADLERLAATTTAAGVQVQLRWRGVRRPLPPEIDMSAYRIVQEAVTNVTRHAEHPSCQVTIDFGDEELAIEVIDPAPSPHPGLSPDPSPSFSYGRSRSLSSEHSPGFSPGSRPSLSSVGSLGSCSDRGLGFSTELRSGSSSDGSGPGLGAVPARGSGSGSGAGRGFGFQGGRGRGRGRMAGVGYGLVGMRERVALLHGVFSAGPRQEGGFRVVARLPVPARMR
ncbi:histidine kinase [Nonomuraea sp. JJY05]|uniref:sensor histidine kinase n=1 Tax=Nonomuraea sp. JJY05 TaxID=3350255 RepID=UPI00373FB2F1